MYLTDETMDEMDRDFAARMAVEHGGVVSAFLPTPEIGYCPMDGAYPRVGCPDCPPADHPLQIAEAERKARMRALNVPAL